jgi:hypothetical protein
MFIVTSKKTFIAPVVAKIPADGGKFTPVKFSVVFKALEKEEVDDLLKRIRENAKAIREGGDVVAPLTDRAVLDEVLEGFHPDLLEEDRTPMVFTPTNVDRLCAIYPLEAAMVKSFFDNYVNGPAKN